MFELEAEVLAFQPTLRTAGPLSQQNSQVFQGAEGLYHCKPAFAHNNMHGRAR